MNDLILGLPFCHRHTLTAGAFFFEIGRGISLGAVYPSIPQALGFFIDAQIDQYATGARLSGDLIKDRLGYDIYGSILYNRAGSYETVQQSVRGQHFGYSNNTARGFGLINYVVASRLRWWPVQDGDFHRVYLEPYAIYNYNPEIKIDCIHDGISHLATFGLMGEAVFSSLEWGFEYGFNRGHLDSLGIDRDQCILADDEGTVVIEHSQVTDEKGDSVRANAAHKAPLAHAPHGEKHNDMPIKRSHVTNAHPLVPLFNNKKFRYRNPATVRYRGSFFVADASYIICKDIFKVSAALGVATGDEDPRRALAQITKETKCIDYNGFITLNESYAGKRVTSTLFFNGFGVFPRVLDLGLEGLSFDPNVLNVTGFTNLVYMGASADYHYKNTFRTWRLCPNLLFYWQENPSTFFEKKELKGKTDRVQHEPRFMDNFLGTELNLIAEYEAIKDLTFFCLSGIFIPGFHFRDIRGIPLNEAQARFINEKKGPYEPVLGNDPAYFFNFGCKYTF